MAHVQWRKEFGADTLDQFVFQERDAIISLYPQGYHKTDKMVSLLFLHILTLVHQCSLGNFRSYLLSSPAPFVFQCHDVCLDSTVQNAPYAAA